MAQSGFEMVRYADDMVVLCRSREVAVAALSALKEWMERAGLTLHPDKTRVVDMTEAGSHFDFLGNRFYRSRRRRLCRLVRPKSLRKRRGGRDRGQGEDHHRWPNRYFTGLGLF